MEGGYGMRLEVEPLDALLPDGIPRSSMIGIFGETGTGKSVLINEIAFRALRRGENVVMLLLEDTPASRVDRFGSLGFDVTGFLREGRLGFIDCFSFRLRSGWASGRVRKVLDHGVVDVEDPRNLEEVWESTVSAVERFKGEGIVLIDSMTEFLTISPDPAQLLESIKVARALLVKDMGIPLFYTFHFGFFDEFRNVLEVVSDGVIDLRFDPEVIGKMLVKQLRVRRMSGARHGSQWVTFDVVRGRGVVTIGR